MSKSNILYEDKSEEELVILPHIEESFSRNEQVLLGEITGEVMLLGRLFYKYRVLKDVMKQLNRCDCIQFISQNTFYVLYVAETSECANFSVAVEDIPEDVFPAVLAKGVIHKNGTIEIDVNSHLRLFAVYTFMKRHVKGAYVTAAGLRHRYCYSLPTDDADSISAENIQTLNYDRFFSAEACGKGLGEAKNEVELLESFDEKDEKNFIRLSEKFKSPVDIIEFFPLNSTHFSKMRLTIKMAFSITAAKLYHEKGQIPTRGEVIEVFADKFNDCENEEFED